MHGYTSAELLLSQEINNVGHCKKSSSVSIFWKWKNVVEHFVNSRSLNWRLCLHLPSKYTIGKYKSTQIQKCFWGICECLLLELLLEWPALLTSSLLSSTFWYCLVFAWYSRVLHGIFLVLHGAHGIVWYWKALLTSSLLSSTSCPSLLNRILAIAKYSTIFILSLCKRTQKMKISW